MSFNAGKLRSPQFIFILYVLVSALLIMIFRFIFPGSESPLPIYSSNWRLLCGALTLFDLLPALAFSALVVPFGMASFEENYQSFSDMFFKKLLVSVIIAICAAVVYGLLSFLVFPMLKNYDDNLRYSGELYQLAKKNAYERRDSGDWQEVSQFLTICDTIWFNNPDLNDLRDEVADNLVRIKAEASRERSDARQAMAREWRGADITPLSGSQQPLDPAQAFIMYADAFREERYFEAHWLATLAGRLAQEGSPEAANASRLAGEAWNKISSQAPNRTEEHIFQIYNLKLSGYQAMNTGDWIRAFYIFQELLAITPDDPDAVNFLAASERGAKEYAFFLDEMELSMGEILTGAVFSLPSGTGRAALRFLSLTTSADVAYVIGFEYMDFDLNSNMRASVSAPYAKLLPFNLNDKPQVLILTHVLDRNNRNRSYEGEWLVGRKTTGEILLDVSYEDLLLLSEIRHGLSNLQIDELFTASKKLDNFGYVSQIFQAEILNRIGSVIFFLPMAIFILILGWRYRAKTKPRYLFILLLPVLPVVFHGFVFMYRSVINISGIWLVLSLGFTPALIVLIAAFAVLLFLSLIILAGQHS
jgi:hypothetical protein